MSGESHAEHFLPVALEDLVEGLIADAQAPRRDALRALFALYVQLFHARLRPDLERLKRAYAPLRPDEDVLDLSELSDEQREAGRERFLAELDVVLRRANYVRLSPEDIDRALAAISPEGLEVSVDLADYQALVLYTRGRGTERSTRRSWRSAYTRRETLETATHRRLFLAISLEPSELHLKLFRDIPESDLEMLLPNTRVRIRVADKIRLGVTGGGGAVGGALSTITKLSATVNPITALLAIGGLGGVLWRQVSNVLAQRTKYMAALRGKLYFHNLDNNQGALTHLVELAGEEECKEALLAYAFLSREPCDRRTLDERVERYLCETYDLCVDYEVEDGLHKLRDCELLVEGSDGALSVVDVPRALRILREDWVRLGGCRA